MSNTRILVAALVAVAGVSGLVVEVSAQPFSLYCGQEAMPPPFPLDSPCRWVCVRERLGNPPPYVAAPQRMVWRRSCVYRLPDGRRAGPVRARTDVVIVRRGRARWVAPQVAPSRTLRRRGQERWLNPQPEPPMRQRGRRWLNPQPEPPMRQQGRRWLNPQPEPPMSPQHGVPGRRRVVVPR